MDDDLLYDINAASDYKREAYGDPCPRHGTLRYGGDCPECEALEDDNASR